MESEAPPSTGWYNFLGWLDANRKRVILGAAIVAIVAAGIAIAVWWKDQRQLKAAEALSAVRVPFNPMETPDVRVADEYLKVSQDYSGTKAGAQALLKAGSVYFANGQFAKAQEQFQRFLKEYSDTPWVSTAQFGIAASLDAENKTTDAIARYNDFLRAYANDPAADEARLSLARLYEKANQPAQAIETLSKMTNAAPFSPIGGEVQDRLKALYAKHPNLAPAPTPRTLPASPASLLTNITRVITNTAGTAGAPAKVNTTTGATAVPKINLQAPSQTNPPAKQ